MEFVTIVLGFFLLYALIQAFFSLFQVGKPKNLPPGPTPLPIIGNLHLLGDHPNQSLTKLSKIHGPIMFLQLGRINTLVISSAAAAKQVLRKQDLAFSTTRHIPDALHAHHHSINSSAWMPVGSQWRTLRRILNNNIVSGDSLDDRASKKIGTSLLDANQHLRNQKVEELVAYCQKASRRGEPVDIGRAGFRTSLNLLSNTVFSKDLTDPFEDSGREFKEVVGNIMMEAGKPNLVDFFPVLKKMDPQGIRRRMNDYFGKVLEMFEELIKERLMMKRLKKDDDDVLDRCLRMCEEIPDEVNRSHIMSLFLDVFIAGTDTTSNTLEWAMTELLLKPNIMAKAKEELEAVIGKGKIVEENDLSRLPYLSCIVKETLRLHPPIPFLIPRKVVNEVKLNDYVVPKGTQVLVNAWAIGRDPSIWEDSTEFKPERFQTSGLDVRGQDFELIPFGAGRRICPGLPLAIRMIPMMLGSLLNNFDWSLNTDIKHEEVDMAERFGITLQKAKPLCVIPLPLT